MKRNSVDRLIDLIGSVMLGLMLVLSLFNVLSSWITKNRYGEIEELVLICFVWVVYMGIGLLYKTKEHISVSFLVQMLPPKGQKIMLVVNDVIVFVSSSIILYYAVKLTIKSVTKYTSVLKVPYCYIDAAVAVGFLSLMIHLLHKLIRLIRTRVKGG